MAQCNHDSLILRFKELQCAKDLWTSYAGRKDSLDKQMVAKVLEESLIDGDASVIKDAR